MKVLRKHQSEDRKKRLFAKKPLFQSNVTSVYIVLYPYDMHLYTCLNYYVLLIAKSFLFNLFEAKRN